MGSAVRFDTATERLNRTTGVLSFDANYSILAWVRITTHPGNGLGACVLSIDDQSANADECYVSGNGATNLSLGIVTVTGGSGQSNVGTATFLAGTWQYLAFVRSANNLRVGYRNGVAEVTHTRDLSGRAAPTMMSWGSVLDSDLFNGRIAHMKLFRAALSIPEIFREMYTVQPVRTADLYGWYPTLPGAGNRGRDNSGNGNHFSEVGTLTDEEGPPVAWRNKLWVIPFLVAAGGYAAGDAAATIGAITASGAGSVGVNGASAATIGAVQAAGSGTLGAAVTGSGAATLGGLTAAGSGSVGANGAVAATLGALSTAAAGSAAIVGTGAATIGSLPATSKAYVLVGACVAGVLRQSAANGRWLANDDGDLAGAGFHTWYNLRSGGSTNPPPAFGWSEFKAALVAYGCNVTKLWCVEPMRHWPSADDQYFDDVLPWLRTGPGTANDGGPKFDLASPNPAYFARLRERCIELGNLGIYVIVQLFNGFGVDPDKPPNGGIGDPWAFHPMNSANNINGANGDTNGDGRGLESRLTSNTVVWGYQLAYVDRVLDVLNSLHNVAYEIANEEDGATANDWEDAHVAHIRAHEAGLPIQHLILKTKLYPNGNNSQLTGSDADAISPDDDLASPEVATGSQVILWDTDHVAGVTSERAWIWKAFCRGNNPLYMDLWDSGAGGAGNTINDATYMQIRRSLGWVVGYGSRIDLANATPQGSLASTGYCLAKTTGAYQLIAYQAGSGAFTVNLSSMPGTFTVEWRRVANSAGTVQAGGTVAGGAVRTLTPPWSSEDVIAFLELAGYSGTGAATIGGLSAGGAGSAAINGAGAATIGAVVAVAVAVVDVAGTSQAVVGELVAAAVGSVAVNSTGAAAVGAVTAAGAAAAAINGDAAATVGALEAAGAGTTRSESVSGGAAAVIGDIVAAGAVSVAVNGAASAVVGEMVAGAVVVVAVHGAAAAVVGAIDASGFGGSGAGGAATATIGDIAASGAGSVAVSGAGLALIGDTTAVGAGSVSTSGAAAAMIGALIAAGAGSVAINGAGLALIGDVVVVGTGSVQAIGGAAVTLGALVAAGAASVAVSGSSGAVLGAIVASGSGALTDLPEIHGVGAATIGAITASGAGVVAWVLALGRIAGPGGAGAVSGPGTRATIGS